MNIPHFKIVDTGWEKCDGNMIDIGTLVAPNRWLCTKCRVVKIGSPEPETVEVIDQTTTTERPGLIRRIWRALF